MQITTFRSNASSKGYVIAVGTPRTFTRSTSRDYFMIHNTDATKDIQVAFGTSPDPADFVTIGAGGFFEPSFTPTSDITVKVAVGPVTVVVITDTHNSTV